MCKLTDAVDISEGVAPKYYKPTGKENYPTPTTRDWKGGRTPEGLQAAGRNENNNLNDKVNTLEQTTGQLNPQWGDWLMGYPVGWTDLKDLEMQLFLK